MAKTKKSVVAYVCSECGAEHSKWQGQCSACGAWNTLQEFKQSSGPARSPNKLRTSYTGAEAAVVNLGEVKDLEGIRLSTTFSEFNRVLGGGLVRGSVILLAGDPGAGKSTLLLQIAAGMSRQVKTLYVSGEESLQQIASRARRLKLDADDVQLASLTSIEEISELVLTEKPGIVVIDSIQVVYTDDVENMPGSVTQVREAATRLTQLAKQTETIFLFVGHVTKEGNLAGPKVLEHIIDCFIMLDAPAGSRYRTLRSAKNRFGAVNELGVFAMTDQGLREVKNPSAIFLERSDEPGPGSVVTVIWEGSRPLLVEIQALVDEIQGGYPRRIAVGLDSQRLSMQLAIMHRHCGLTLNDQDVFANVTGGVRVLETATDLASIVAVYSSFRSRPVPHELVVFGELGLTGEIRPVPNGQERLREAQKHGFTHAIVPFANQPKAGIKGIETYPVKTLGDALETLTQLP